MTTSYLSISEFTGDGVTTEWDFNFAGGYISRDHVFAYTKSADGVVTHHELTFVSDFRVVVTPAVPAGDTLRIYRNTPREEPIVNFTGGSNFTEANLDLLARQTVFVAAEAFDAGSYAYVNDLLAAAANAKSESAASALEALAAAEDSHAAATEAAELVAPALAAKFASMMNPLGEWATATAYSASGAGGVRDTFTKDGVAYVVVVDHTSGVFADDLAAGKFFQNDAAQLGINLADVNTKLEEIPSLRDHGGVADYLGEPLYDGADSGRVSATDNTAAFTALVNSAILAGHSSVKIPSGHWAIKLGNIVFPPFNKLRIFGDGVGTTTLDFIKEDTSNPSGSYVNDAMAHCIASFSTGESLEFSDLTIKATTKGGRINGAAGSNDIYSGMVWGFKISNVKDVRFTRVRAEHFNYRGFSVYGSGTVRVTMLHCEGFYNTGSGFWVQDANTFKVKGGEFAFNGVLGESGTGYGVTGSSKIGKMIVDGVYCHNNYRKGIDTHGATEFFVTGSKFENNLLYHIAAINVNPPHVSGGCAVIVGNTFSNGRTQSDKDWMTAGYDALAINGFKNSDGSGSTGAMILQVVQHSSYPLSDVSFDRNKVLSHYNGGEAREGIPTVSTASPIFINCATSGEISFSGNSMNLKGMSFSAGGSVYGHVALVLLAKTVRLSGNTVKIESDSAYTNPTSGASDVGVFIQLKASQPREVYMDSNNFSMRDMVLFADTGAGLKVPVPWSNTLNVREFFNNSIEHSTHPYTTASELNSDFFFGLDVSGRPPIVQGLNRFKSGGVSFDLPPGNMNKTYSKSPYNTPFQTKAIGDVLFYLVIRKKSALSVKVTTNSGTGDVVVNVPDSGFTFTTPTSTNTQIEFNAASSSTSFTDTDGVEKIKIGFSSKLTLSGKSTYGEVTVSGALPSLGLERVVYL